MMHNSDNSSVIFSLSAHYVGTTVFHGI